MPAKKRILNTLLAFILTFSLLAVSSGSALAKKNDPPKADPRLLQMAEENPDATFMVIVQKEAKNKDLKDMELESEVLKGGGQVTKQLDLIVSFSAELTGKELTKLAKHPKVRWISADAPMVSTAKPGMDTVRDDFKDDEYDLNDGTVKWSTNWIEIGDDNQEDKGRILVTNSGYCSNGSGNCLRLDPENPGNTYVYRQADLSRAVSVWLFFYRNNLLNSSKGKSEEVQLEISPNGGANWTTLRTYSSTSYTGAATDSFDISAYATANTQIRFRVGQYQSGYRYIYFDNIEIAFAYPSAFLETVGVNQLTQASGLNGQGVTVAVVDSGISNHIDFSSNMTAMMDLVMVDSDIPYQIPYQVYTTVPDSRIIADTKFGSFLTTGDFYGHGTHVAGTIGGTGSASGGKYRGVAPGVNLVNVKVSDDFGMTYEFNLVAGLQWIYNNKDVYNIRVVNLSMNSTVEQSYHTSPLDAAVEILWFNGIVVVVSAGNNGTADGPSTLYPPANDPFVITVGATEDKGTGTLSDDNLAVFSAYGTTIDGFAKPDLVAPGRNVVAPLGGLFNVAFKLHPLHRVNDYYFRMSGTSMSAPVVSGAVALLLQDEPNLNPDQVKYRLMATANQNWNYSATQSGAGYLDAYAAVYGTTDQSANQGLIVSQMLSTGSDPISWGSVGWNTVGWNTVGWNTVGWNTVGWNTNTWDE